MLLSNYSELVTQKIFDITDGFNYFVNAEPLIK